MCITIGAQVSVRGIHISATVVAEDTQNTSSVRLPGERLWVLRFADGASGGGWRDGELTLA